MKSELSYTAARSRKYLGLCLAALVTASSTPVWAQDSEVQRLQEEVAALRRRLAEAEGRATAAPTVPATTTADPAVATASVPATAATLGTDAGVESLSPFEVASEKDTGYLRTNSVTATRINMPIQNIPISVSVMSKDFIDDANIRSITDVLRYTSSGAGDNNFAMRRPANSATAQGNFTLRGFGVNSLLRNGVSRYIGYNVNNVDRIEIVKGPASVFFGAGYPGGVINYITKQPVLAKIPTTIQYTTGSDNLNRAVIDQNTQLSKKAAMRIVGSWENSGGARAFEFNKTNTLTANLSLIPFESGKVKMTFEIEHYDSKFNSNQGDWIYPTGWFEAYQNPSAELMAAGGSASAAAYRTRIATSPTNWIADVRKAANDYSIPLYTQVTRGAYYTDANGNRVKDEGFNYTNRGSYSKQTVDTPSFTLEISPVSWLDARYVMTRENGRFDNVEGTVIPTADGRTFNAQNGYASSGYYRKIENHQFDFIFKLDGWGIKNRLLVGGVHIKQFQQYNANSPLSPNYSQIPGATNAAGNPGVVINGTVGTGGSLAPYVSTADVPVNQVIRDRFGNIKTVQQVYTQYDPGYEIAPDISKILLYDRTLLDGYKTQYQAGYINYNGSLLDDRLNILAGVRREMNRDSGQSLVSNFPWYSTDPYAWADQTTYPPDVYNYTPSYAGGYSMFQRQAGTSWMAGVSFAVTKEVNVFASYSKTFRLNTGNVGNVGDLDIPNIYGAAMAYAASQGRSSFVYDGQTVTSQDQFRQILADKGALTKLSNEDGFNAELGVKTSLWDSKLVGTFSVFRMERSNQKIDDTARAASEGLNYGNNTSIFGPSGTVYNGITYNANSRVIRWYTTGVKNRIEGADFDFVWTPTRNFQTVLGGAWLWTAKTLENPTVAKPGTAAYDALTGVNKVNAWLQYTARLENVPEYQLKSQSKYTFTDGTFAGLSLGVGARYSSKTVISRTADYNPENGGLTGGNFLVWDLTVGYPWEVLGYKVSSQVGIYNVLDKDYIEGATTVLSPPRTWTLSNTLKF